MQRFIARYLNEIVSLALMALMIVALVHTQSQIPGGSERPSDVAPVTHIALDSPGQ